MENASKALLIAAGVFLALMVLSLGIYLHGRLSQSTSSYINKLDAAELTKYNAPFEVLADRENITAQEIASIIEDSKQKEFQVQIIVDGNNMERYSINEINNFLDENIMKDRFKLIYFKCDSIEYETDINSVYYGRVTKVTLSQI